MPIESCESNREQESRWGKQRLRFYIEINIDINSRAIDHSKLDYRVIETETKRPCHLAIIRQV